jgi:hypothetical protein
VFAEAGVGIRKENERKATRPRAILFMREK